MQSIANSAQSAAISAQNTANNKAQIYCGTYTGNNSSSRTISLSFTPKAVLLFNNWGAAGGGNDIYGGLAIQGTYVGPSNNIAIEIITNGFKVYYNYSNQVRSYTNASNYSYMYIAFN